jgi:hypothetical protein
MIIIYTRYITKNNFYLCILEGNYPLFAFSLGTVKNSSNSFNR